MCLCSLSGVLIACYLVYTLRLSPSEAVHYVRIKRPRSIQTRAQINQVFSFARLLGTQLVQYPDLSLRHGAPFTLQHYLNRQALLLHGQEGRALRYTPKVRTGHECRFHGHRWLGCRMLSPHPQVVYLLCVRLSCLALGLPAPPEVHAELEKRSAQKALNRMVRETLVTKHYLPLINESNKSSWGGSVTSWDDPLGCLERRKELLANKRSFSDSDLSKLKMQEVCLSFYRFRCVNAKPEQPHIIFPLYSLLKDNGWSPYDSPTMGRHWCTLDLIRADLKPVNSTGAPLSPDNQTRKNHPHPTMSSESWKSTIKRPLHKHSSSMEVILSLAAMTTLWDVCYQCDLCPTQLCRNPHHPNSTSVARLVAKAMAAQGPHGETVLQRSALLQVISAATRFTQRRVKSPNLEHLKLPGCSSGGAEQQRLWLGSARHRVRSTSSQLPLVDLA